jgi:ABC-type phosphate transport system ATPase subunit
MNKNGPISATALNAGVTSRNAITIATAVASSDAVLDLQERVAKLEQALTAKISELVQNDPDFKMIKLLFQKGEL